MTVRQRGLAVALFIVCLAGVAGCSPEVGSEAWCTEMKQKPKQEWSAQEAADYTRYCVLKLDRK